MAEWFSMKWAKMALSQILFYGRMGGNRKWFSMKWAKMALSKNFNNNELFAGTLLANNLFLINLKTPLSFYFFK